MNLSETRRTVVNAIGTRAIHAVEDGLSVGVLVGLAVTLPAVAVAVAGALGVIPSRAGPLALVRELPDIVRTDDARAQESYFMAGFLGGASGGSAVGWILSAVAVVPL
jgi:hypothetical protein